ncbi:MAG: D-ribose pyranase [Clostridia bacterium]|nr:D-ribose pyranase [Clostridia bacterium]
MRKGKLLNSNIVSMLSKMGHTDQLTIGDAGLPIPNGVERIDLALVNGIPGFLETVKAIEKDMVVEKIILAEEIRENNPEVLKELETLFKGLEMLFVPHEIFKEQTAVSKAVVRTGECTPYANVILQSGVDFSEA